MPYKPLVLTLALLAIAALATGSRADDGVAQLRFDQHQFKPLKLEVPAGRPLIIKVTNASKETIEFESFKLNREKAVTPGETITVHLPALSAGTYDFYDDFHQDVPEGSIVAR
jgi:plastocyanin